VVTAAAAIPVNVRPLLPLPRAGSPVGSAPSSPVRGSGTVRQSLTEAYGSEAAEG